MDETLEKVAAVIESVCEGRSLSDALTLHELKRSHFYKAIAEKPELGNAYTRAQRSRADLMADQVPTLADGDGDPAKVRNQIMARQWYTAKAAPQIYGERLDLNLNQTVDLTAALLDAKKRLLQSRFNDDAEDAQVVEPLQLPHSGATAEASVPPHEGDESQDENDFTKDPPGGGGGGGS